MKKKEKLCVSDIFSLDFIKSILSVISGTTFIFVLIGVNMIGYSVGVSGTSDILLKFQSREGYRALACSYSILAVGVCIMKYIERLRESRGDSGDKKRKCS